jgi:hypothetical protein
MHIEKKSSLNTEIHSRYKEQRPLDRLKMDTRSVATMVGMVR